MKNDDPGRGRNLIIKFAIKKDLKPPLYDAPPNPPTALRPEFVKVRTEFQKGYKRGASFGKAYSFVQNEQRRRRVQNRG